MGFPLRKILIVESEKLHRNLLQKVILEMRYTVEFTESAEKALKILKNEKIPLVMTDLFLPGMDASEFRKRVKKINAESVIYALSKYVPVLDVEELIKIGFDGCLSKPAKIYILKQAVKGAFDRIDLKREKEGGAADPGF
jgi:CheY-like chemotaxis protein